MLGLPTPSCVSRSSATSPNESSRQLAARGSQTQFFPVLHRLVDHPQSTLCRLHPIPRQASLPSVAFLSSRSPPNLCSRQMGYAPCQILASLAAPATVNALLILSLLMSLKQTASNSRRLARRPHAFSGASDTLARHCCGTTWRSTCILRAVPRYTVPSRNVSPREWSWKTS